MSVVIWMHRLLDSLKILAYFIINFSFFKENALNKERNTIWLIDAYDILFKTWIAVIFNFWVNSFCSF